MIIKQLQSTSKLATSQDLCSCGGFLLSEYDKKLKEIMHWVLSAPTKPIKPNSLIKTGGI
jgi:hypothetical protein